VDLLQYVHVSLTQGNPEIDTALQIWSHQGRVEGKDHLLRPAGDTFPNAGHNAVGRLCHKGLLLAHIHLGVHWDPQNHRMVGVGRDLCGSSSPTPCLLLQKSLCRSPACTGIWDYFSELQDFAHPFVELHKILLCSLFQPVVVPRNGR